MRLQVCEADLGYEISLKTGSGYCVDALYQKLALIKNLKRLVDKALCGNGKTYKNNVINFCNKKVFMSKNNSLFLDNIDSNSCKEELELAENCCIDTCTIESKINEICKNC